MSGLLRDLWETIKGHAEGDQACGRTWTCACAACRQAKALALTDADRAAQARRRGPSAYGPWELDRCEHGMPLAYVWVWPLNGTPEDADAILQAEADCTQCDPELEA